MTLRRSFSGAKPHVEVPSGTIDTQLHMYLPEYPSQPGGPPLPEGLPGPDDYRHVMKWLGIDRFVVTQGNAHQSDNENLLACLSRFGDECRGVAVVTAETPDDEIARLHDSGVRGARIMDLPGGAVGLSRLQEVDARVLDVDWCIAVQFDGSRLLEHLPLLQRIRSRFIIDHHGKFLSGTTPDSAEVHAIEALIDRGNCWFKLAGCYESSIAGPPGYHDVAAVAREIAAYAPDRIVWGTNWPHNLVKRTEDYPDDAELMDTVLGWLPSDEARHRALVDNPEELFRFPRWRE